MSGHTLEFILQEKISAIYISEIYLENNCQIKWLQLWHTNYNTLKLIL